TQRPEWQALFNPVNNLVYNADGRSVHTVVVDGRVVVDAYRQTFVDESRLYSTVQEIGGRLLARTGVSFPPSPWPLARSSARGARSGGGRHLAEGGDPEARADLAEALPRGVLDGDAFLLEATLGAVLDLPGVEDFLEALRGRRLLEVADEGVDLLLEVA